MIEICISVGVSRTLTPEELEELLFALEETALESPGVTIANAIVEERYDD